MPFLDPATRRPSRGSIPSQLAEPGSGGSGRPADHQVLELPWGCPVSSTWVRRRHRHHVGRRRPGPSGAGRIHRLAGGEGPNSGRIPGSPAHERAPGRSTRPADALVLQRGQRPVPAVTRTRPLGMGGGLGSPRQLAVARETTLMSSSKVTTRCWECGAPTSSPGPMLLVIEDGVRRHVPSHHCDSCSSDWQSRVAQRQALVRAHRRLGYPPRVAELEDVDWCDEPQTSQSVFHPSQRRAA